MQALRRWWLLPDLGVILAAHKEQHDCNSKGCPHGYKRTDGGEKNARQGPNRTLAWLISMFEPVFRWYCKLFALTTQALHLSP
jgi:hypothetical protein